MDRERRKRDGQGEVKTKAWVYLCYPPKVILSNLRRQLSSTFHVSFNRLQYSQRFFTIWKRVRRVTKQTTKTSPPTQTDQTRVEHILLSLSSHNEDTTSKKKQGVVFIYFLTLVYNRGVVVFI